jgi:hypothetical protein
MELRNIRDEFGEGKPCLHILTAVIGMGTDEICSQAYIGRAHGILAGPLSHLNVDTWAVAYIFTPTSGKFFGKWCQARRTKLLNTRELKARKLSPDECAAAAFLRGVLIVLNNMEVRIFEPHVNRVPIGTLQP